MFALRHFFCTLAPFDFDKADGCAGSFWVRVSEEVRQRADRAPPIVRQYAGVYEAIDGVFGPVADVVGIDAAVLGNPVEDEIHGRRNGFELAAGDPGYLVGLLLFDLGVAGPVPLGAGKGGVGLGSSPGIVIS